jgi:hypothetical protein
MTLRWPFRTTAQILAVISAMIAGLCLSATRVCAEQKYVGLTLCSPELQTSRPDIRVALDRGRNAYVVYREVPKARIVMIVLYADQNDKCGSIHDAREIRNSHDVFADDCTDVLHVEEIVVGLFDQKFDPNHPLRQLMRGPAVQSWKIDLKTFKFLWKSTTLVTCRARTGIDDDSSGDLATWARDRVVNASGVGREKIVIRMLNGKNRKPIHDEIPNVWLCSSGPINGLRGSTLGFQADSKGEIQIDVTDIRPRDLRIAPDYYVDCRFSGDQFGGDTIKYALEEIIAEGIVSQNMCGAPHVQPTPGVLILYVRPRTWREKRDL